MVKRPKIKAESEPVGMKALCFLHYRYAHSEDTVFTEKELSEQLIGVSKRILHYALGDLRSEENINWESVEEDGDDVDGFSISRGGIDLVESWDDKFYEKVAEGIDFLEGDDKREVPEKDSKNDWQPLPIERESPEYVEAVSKSEEALEVIEGDNGYADSEPEERNHIVWSVGAGVNALKEGLITKQQVDSLLLAPLRRVIKRLKEGVTVEAARAAVQAIVEWLKGLI